MLDVASAGDRRTWWPRRALRWPLRSRVVRNDRPPARHTQPRQARRAAADAGRRRRRRDPGAGASPTSPPFPEEPAETARRSPRTRWPRPATPQRPTGLASVADDSGLAVDALGGMPGVLSARWSGRHGDDRANLELVLGQLADVPDERRGAAFVCAAALVVPGGEDIVVHGEWTGRLIREPRGDQRLRVRPDLRLGRRGPDVGRAGARGEGRPVAPRAGDARVAAAPAGAGSRGRADRPQVIRPAEGR